jgi:aminoglycoside phosphotransferase family enzyme
VRWGEKNAVGGCGDETFCTKELHFKSATESRVFVGIAKLDHAADSRKVDTGNAGAYRSGLLIY